MTCHNCLSITHLATNSYESPTTFCAYRPFLCLLYQIDLFPCSTFGVYADGFNLKSTQGDFDFF